MRVVLFVHSLLSDWNHGNAHFLRGVASELQRRGHKVDVYEPRDAWSVRNLLHDHGRLHLEEVHRVYPHLRCWRYDLARLDLVRELRGADLVLVHEWNDPELVAAIGDHRRRGGDYTLFFHDTHHRSVTQPLDLADLDLRGYDGVLAFGAAVRDIYLLRGWAQRVWVWHEAADVEVFKPLGETVPEGEVVWIGNWGDEERSAQLEEFFIEPVRRLGLRARAYGVRYPAAALSLLARANITYGGWLPNVRVPAVYASYRVTVHVPQRPYREELPGIPTIRLIEALACGIPLVSTPWDDREGLFTPGLDYLVAHDGQERQDPLRRLLTDRGLARDQAAHGLRTIRARHTCGHRVDELLAILKFRTPGRAGRAAE
jgi:spore maturation protein CgeB